MRDADGWKEREKTTMRMNDDDACVEAFFRAFASIERSLLSKRTIFKKSLLESFFIISWYLGELVVQLSTHPRRATAVKRGQRP